MKRSPLLEKICKPESSAIRKKWNMQVQHEKIAARKICNMENVSHEKSAMQEKCNMEIAKHEQSAKRKK